MLGVTAPTEFCVTRKRRAENKLAKFQYSDIENIELLIAFSHCIRFKIVDSLPFIPQIAVDVKRRRYHEHLVLVSILEYENICSKYGIRFPLEVQTLIFKFSFCFDLLLRRIHAIVTEISSKSTWKSKYFKSWF